MKLYLYVLISALHMNIAHVVKANPLTAVEQYVSYNWDDEGSLHQSIDISAMKQDAVNKSLIDLTIEVVECNNKMLDYSSRDRDINEAYLSETCEAMRAFDKNNADKDTDTHPCGTKSNPVPDYAGKWNTYSSYPTSSANKLVALGFHRTVGYACGADVFVTCETDHTRGRGYESWYGSCPSPVFRDQAIASSEYEYKIQEREPNPEIHSYRWPYLTWGAYVKWWHDTH